MESIIFDYIGYVFVFCAAFCLVAPLVVHLVSLAVGAVWQVIDEGDSKAPDLLNKLAPFLYSSGKIVAKDGLFAIVNSYGQYYDPSDGKFWIQCFHKTHSMEAAKSSLKIIKARFDFKLTLLAFAAFSFLGIGFVLIPTITMYALSSALCLYSLRWSRRGYKKVMKLKVALDEHTKDKAAHK